MKKIISYVLLLTLVVNVFAINVFATTETAITAEITFDEKDGHLDNDGNVNIAITAESGKDMLIKIVDINDQNTERIVYIKALLGEENQGSYTINIKKTDLGLGKKFKLVVSNGNEGLEKEFEVKKWVKETPGGGGGVGVSETKVSLEDQEGKNQDKLLENAAKVNTVAGATAAIDNMAKGVSNETKALSETSENAALVTNTMARNLGAKNVSIAKNNSLAINAGMINASDLAKVENVTKTIMERVSKNGYTYNREIEKELVLNVKFNQGKKATIVISQSVIDALKGIDILTIADEEFHISFRIEDLKKELAEMEDGKNFEIYIERVEITDEENEKLAAANFDFISAEDYKAIALATKKVAKKVSFNKEKLAGNVNVSVPPASKSNTDFQSVKNAEDDSLVGGKYNAATGMVEVEIGAGGTYIVEENQVNFKDIENKETAMKDAIRILAAKGIIEGVGEGKFSPDASLSRAEFAKLLVKTLYSNGTGKGFTDTAGTWYESYAKAARGAGIINGYDDGTFRGDTVIQKEQIIAIAARTLREKKKYFNPKEPSKYLSKFKDNASISDWAIVDLSLASRENLIIERTDGMFRGSQNMTRGEAALVLKRLFDRL